MSIPPISYEAFRASNQAFSGDGGPWYLSFGPRQDHTGCASIKSSYCDGYCIQCRVFPPGDVPTYHATYNTNISVDMEQYGGGSRLEFTWSFWPLFCGTGIPSGTSVPIYSKVGDIGWDDSFPAVEFQTWDSGRDWSPESRVTHSSTTSVNRDNSTAYLPISISFDFRPTGDSQFLDYYVKGISLQISAFDRGNPPGVPSIRHSSTSSVPSGGFVTALLSDANLYPAPTPTVVSGPVLPPTPPTSTPTELASSGSEVKRISTAAVAGTTVGGVILIALFVVAILLHMRRRRRLKHESFIAISRADFHGTDKGVLAEARKTAPSGGILNHKSRQTTASVRFELPSQDQDGVHPQQMPALRVTREALLAALWPSLESETPSERDNRQSPSLNLTEFSLGGSPEPSYPFSARSSSIYSRMPHEQTPLNVYDHPLPPNRSESKL